ncbi:MAG: LysR family transcriptional regulator [Myxococcales bacterium]|nr:LysR family transcriptional regulator [Myxococcales bacterium]
MSWDDLRIVLAVAEAGGLKAAAAELGVNATTVSRRIRRFERALGVKLFDRLTHGVVLSDAGAEAVSVARTMRDLTADLDARLGGRDARLEGTIRVTSIEPLLKRWLPDLRAFRERYPGIVLELDSAASLANLTHREADVAVRVAVQVPEHLVGKRCAEVHHAVYASEELVQRLGEDAPLVAFPWVGYDLRVYHLVDQFIARNAPGARIGLRVGGIQALVDAVAGGHGASVMQCLAGDAHPKLRRIGNPPFGGSYLWVLTHPELRGSARISTFMRFVRGLIERDLDLIEGRAP